eukprot:1830919-Rhodomonas_salina.2
MSKKNSLVQDLNNASAEGTQADLEGDGDAASVEHGGGEDDCRDRDGPNRGREVGQCRCWDGSRGRIAMGEACWDR